MWPTLIPIVRISAGSRKVLWPTALGLFIVARMIPESKCSHPCVLIISKLEKRISA